MTGRLWPRSFDFVVCLMAVAFTACSSASRHADGATESVAAGGGPLHVKVTSAHMPVIEGEFFELTVTADQPLKSVDARFMGRKFALFPAGDGRFAAIVGVEVDYKVGENQLELKAKLESGDDVSTTTPVVVKAGDFPSETLTVQPRKVQPLKSDMKRIKREQVLINAAYASSAQKRYWDPPLIMPIDADLTSKFGSKRVYNGVKASAHYGTDIRAKVGTPVAAPIAARVALARNLFFTGNTVILDHGFGFFTIYAHLSRMNVKQGDELKKGEIMGLSGATGRVSGPHLHWGVHLHGVKIDPLSLVRDLK